MRLGRNGAERNGAGGKALDDLPGRLDFRQRYRPALRLELEQATQRQVTLGLIVDQRGIFLVRFELAGTRRMLQLGDGIRCPYVLFAADAEGVFTTGIEHVGEHRIGRERFLMQADRLLGHLEEADPLDVGRRAGEVLLDEILFQTDGLEDLGAGVGHVGGDAHLGHDLAQTLADRLDVVLDELVGLLGIPFGQPLDSFEGQVRVNRLGAVTTEQREVMRFARRTGLDHETGAGAQTFFDQMLMNRRGREQCRNGDMPGINLAVGDDQDVGARTHGVFGIGRQRGQTRLDAGRAPGQRITDIQLEGTELAGRVGLDVAQLLDFRAGQHRLRYFQANRRIDVVRIQQVRLRPDKGHQRHDQFLADRVDRRVGHLGEQLLEVRVKYLALVRQDWQGRVRAHRPGCLLAVLDHRLEDDLDVFLGIAEGLLAIEQRSRGSDAMFVGCRHFVELDTNLLDPLAIWLGIGQGILEFLVVDDAALFHVDQEHLARLQAPLLDDLFFRNRQHARFGGHDHHVVVGHQIAGRTQTVAVERRADLATIGEGDGGGAVPRLHHRRVIFVESATVFVHQRVLFPGFRDHQHHGLGQRVAAAHD